MQNAHYQAIVVGAGALGAATAACLPGNVLVIDAGIENDDRRSSKGHTRVSRRTNNEHPVLDKTAEDSLEAMRKMEIQPGSIVRDMPATFIAGRDSSSHAALLASMKKAGLQVTQHSAEELSEDYGLRVGHDHVGIVDRNAATFDLSQILDKLYEGITHRQGSIFFQTRVTDWHSDKNGVTVTATKTRDGDGKNAGSEQLVFSADQLVLAAGAWMPQLLGMSADEKVRDNLAPALAKLQRIPVLFFEYPNMPDIIPVYMFDNSSGDSRANGMEMYFMPEYRPDGTKLLKGALHYGQITDRPENIVREVDNEERATIQARMEDRLSRKLTFRESTVCVYPGSKDDLPVAGALPGTPNVFINAGTAGYGAKHALALGRAVSAVMQGHKSPYDLKPFAPDRFLPQGQSKTHGCGSS